MANKPIDSKTINIARKIAGSTWTTMSDNDATALIARVQLAIELAGKYNRDEAEQVAHSELKPQSRQAVRRRTLDDYPCSEDSVTNGRSIAHLNGWNQCLAAIADAEAGQCEAEKFHDRATCSTWNAVNTLARAAAGMPESHAAETKPSRKGATAGYGFSMEFSDVEKADAFARSIAAQLAKSIPESRL